MAIRLEVLCEASPDQQVGVAGAEAALGQWDPTKAVQLQRTEASSSTWTGEIPMPQGGGEFKLVLLKGSEVSWEPLEDNRRWPSTGLGQGTTLRMKYGEGRIGVEASPEQIEANARAVKKLEERQGSALQENVDTKGENAYYFAHTRKFEVPPDAKVITGPGLITGGTPILIEAGAMAVDSSEEDRTVWLKDYSWADSNGKVKVYVTLPEGLLPATGADELVEASFANTQVDLTIKSKPRHGLKIEKLNGELKIEECSTRVEAHKNRVVLQLAKKRETTWYSLTKK